MGRARNSTQASAHTARFAAVLGDGRRSRRTVLALDAELQAQLDDVAAGIVRGAHASAVLQGVLDRLSLARVDAGIEDPRTVQLADAVSFAACSRAAGRVAAERDYVAGCLLDDEQRAALPDPGPRARGALSDQLRPAPGPFEVERLHGDMLLLLRAADAVAMADAITASPAAERAVLRRLLDPHADQFAERLARIGTPEGCLGAENWAAIIVGMFSAAEQAARGGLLPSTPAGTFLAARERVELGGEVWSHERAAAQQMLRTRHLARQAAVAQIRAAA